MNGENNELLGRIETDDLIIGKGVFIAPGASITANKVVLGDNCFIGPNVNVTVGEFRLGDYSRIQGGTVGFGKQPLRIGRNCWIGGRCDLDSQGGLDIEDNVGIGSMSQLWTHIRHGDVVEGCRFESYRYMKVGKDVWFVGSCLVSPVEVGERSMAMLGSVITSAMLPDRTYAGVPAKDITEKTGPQFDVITTAEKRRRLVEHISVFEENHPQFRGLLVAVDSPDEASSDDDKTYFVISERTYTKKLTEAEVRFFKEDGLVKFAPLGEGSFVSQD